MSKYDILLMSFTCLGGENTWEGSYEFDFSQFALGQPNDGSNVINYFDIVNIFSIDCLTTTLLKKPGELETLLIY